MDSSFLGYKTHIAMRDERIITAAIVATGEATGMEMETVIGDTAYSEKRTFFIQKKKTGTSI
ncbi:hypothetical protein UB32_13675 [Mesobacillus subterraneus]|uniref:Transposase IS4-like domain-containing protein n=1 Tax=Mesobacillus subterraneus TaxID=285983 RepID=A0A0D6ZA58_9BACI|nr:hypothetical protein UB32_13675 [Mesobacillus subterraneus]